jgi:hypothetical protein
MENTPSVAMRMVRAPFERAADSWASRSDMSAWAYLWGCGGGGGGEGGGGGGGGGELELQQQGPALVAAEQQQ